MTLPCVPVVCLWPCVSGSLLIRANVNCLRMLCRQCIQAASSGNSCFSVSASIPVGVCVLPRRPSTPPGQCSRWGRLWSTSLRKAPNCRPVHENWHPASSHLPSLFLVPPHGRSSLVAQCDTICLLSGGSWWMPGQGTAFMTDFLTFFQICIWRFFFTLNELVHLNFYTFTVSYLH